MIFYFSATGNSKYVAARIAEATGDTAISIPDWDGAPVSIPAGGRLGIVTPDYCGGLPSVTADFLKTARFELQEDAAQSDVDTYIVSVDPEGVLGWASKYIEKKGRPRAHVIEVLTGQVSDEYLAYLRSFDISYIFAGEKELDCALALRKLKELFHIDRLILAGGAVMNASLLQGGLIDELSILMAPVADGGDGAALFRRGGILPDRPPIAFTLKDVKRLEGDGLWLRYQKQEG